MLAQAMKEIRVHGQEKRYVHTRVGVGGRMDTLQCAVVLAEARALRLGSRAALEDRCTLQPDLLFGKLPTVTQRLDRSSVFAQFTVMVEDRQRVQNALSENGVPQYLTIPYL